MMNLKASKKNLQIMAALIANLPKTCPIFLITATHSNDQKTADKQAWSLLSTTVSILNTQTINTMMQDSPIHVTICLWE